jgi:hypothetical protein
MHLNKSIGWKPTCEVDGSYSAIQCRGDKATGRFVTHLLIIPFNITLHPFPGAFVIQKQVKKFSAGTGGKMKTVCRVLAVVKDLQLSRQVVWM